MVVSNVSNAADMARWLSHQVKEEPSVRELWFRQFGTISELWLVTVPTDLQTEQRLRRAGRLLHGKFPGALIDYQVLNRDLVSEAGLETLIPKDAECRRIH
jgi:hypothetical protein